MNQELPEDRTGELHNLLSFIHNNLVLCKWAALAIFATQVISSFFHMFFFSLVITECIHSFQMILSGTLTSPGYDFTGHAICPDHGLRQ